MIIVNVLLQVSLNVKEVFPVLNQTMISPRPSGLHEAETTAPNVAMNISEISYSVV